VPLSFFAAHGPAGVLASLLDVHIAWAWVVIISNGLAGVWALGAHWWPWLRTRALWWFTVFAEFSVFIQVALGVGLVAGEKLTAPKFHLFYGFVAIIAVGILFGYRDQMRHRLYLLYGGGGLFMMGLAIRAMLVAHAAVR
jgi:predicted anti-sigma-YlaC factor YlaD